MDLCATCQNLDLQSWTKDAFPWRGYPLVATLENAENGCPFCSLLVNCSPHIHWPAAPTDWGQRADADSSLVLPELARKIVEYSVGRWLVGPVLRANLRWHWFNISLIRGDTLRTNSALDIKKFLVSLAANPEYQKMPPTEAELEDQEKVRSGPYHVFELHVVADHDSPAALSGDVSGRYTEVNTRSDEHDEMIGSWLQDCASNHPECNQSLSGQQRIDLSTVPMPSRCIEIDDSLSLRLRETSHMRGRYIIVSHRWLPEVSLCSTTLENYSSRLQSLDMKSLPRHFRDICYLARRLGIKHVWIDSLCIIQNSIGDWIEEASMMADYYQQAYATVAIAIPDPNMSGIFTTPGVETLKGFAQLPYRDKSGEKNGHFYVYGIDLANQYRAVGGSELLGRGWIFQEWLLSRRILCAHPSGFFLQCQRHSPRNYQGDAVAFPSRTRQFAQVASKAGFRLNLLQSAEDILKAWRAMVEAYSGLRFTNAREDRIIALAGIAQEVGLAIKKKMNAVPTFVSGLWLEDLARGLLWEQIESGSHERLENLPTWSWASIGTGVKWAEERRGRPHQTVNIEFVAAVPASSLGGPSAAMDSELHDSPCLSPSLSITKANQSIALRVRSVMLPVTIGGRFTETDTKFTAEVTGHQPDFGRDSWRPVTTNACADTVSGWASIEDPGFQSDEHIDCVAISISNVRVFFSGFGLGYISPYHDVYAVLFLRPEDGADDRYRRVGVGRLFGKDVDGLIKATEVSQAVLL